MYETLVATAIAVLERYDGRNYDDHPLSYAVYLQVLLENDIHSQREAELIAWAKTFTSNIIQSQDLTRYVDEEVTAALYLNRVLEDFRQRPTPIAGETLNSFAAQFYDSRCCFFDNLAYSAATLWALSSTAQKPPFFPDAIAWIQARANQALLNPVTLLFVTRLFQELSQETALKEIAARAKDALLQGGSLPMYDRVYLCDVTWTFKDLLDTDDASAIHDLVRTTLGSAEVTLQEVDGHSIMYLATLLGLAFRFSRELRSMEREALEKKYSSSMVTFRFGGVLLSLIPLALGWWAFELLRAHGFMELDTYTLDYGFGPLIARMLTAGVAATILCNLLLLSLTLLHNITYLGLQSDRLVCEKTWAVLRAINKRLMPFIFGTVVATLISIVVATRF